MQQFFSVPDGTLSGTVDTSTPGGVKDLEITNDNVLQNEDVQALEAMRIKYEQEIAREKLKYSQLLAYTVNGGKLSAEKQAPEKSPEEKWKDACDVINNKKSTNIEIAQALLEGDSLYRAKNNGRSIFCSEEGTLSDKEEKIADSVVAIIQDSLDKAEGNDKVYSTLSASNLI